MSPQRQFEGPDVRVLLDQICTTYGTEPTIARAETFRTGGVLGFFQREHYRLVIDAETEAAMAAPLPEAAEEITAAEYFDKINAAPIGSSSWGTEAADPFAAIADETIDQTEVAPAAWGAPAQISDLPSFDEVLRRVADMVDAPVAAPVVWPRLDRATGNEWAEPAVGYPSPRILDAVAELEALIVPGALAATTESAAIDDAPEDDGIVTIHEGNTVSVYRRQPGADEVESLPMAGQDLVGRLSGPEAAQETGAPAGQTVEVHRRMARRLMDAGLDPAAAARVRDSVNRGRSLESSLMDVMKHLPAADRAPRRAGSIIVVVGAGQRAGEEAARIAGEVGADPAEVAFATDRRPVWSAPEELLVRSAGEAAALAPSLRIGQVAIVAVDAPTASRTATIRWARRVIDAFDPTHVVGIADAMHKSEDVATWIAALGGVDTMVVDNVDATASPARITELGVPISRLGDQAATPARWAATILDRVADGPTDIDLCGTEVGKEANV